MILHIRRRPPELHKEREAAVDDELGDPPVRFTRECKFAKKKFAINFQKLASSIRRGRVVGAS